MWIFVLDFGLFKLLDSSVISDSVTIVADDEEVTNWFWFRLTGFILIGDFDFEFDRVLDLDVFLLCFLYFDDFDFFLLDFLLRVSVDELLNIGIIINILILENIYLSLPWFRMTTRRFSTFLFWHTL